MKKKILIVLFLFSLLISIGCSNLPTAEEYYKVGESFFSQGKFDEAGACFEEVLKIDPNYKIAKYNLFSSWIIKANLAYMEENYSEAVKYYEKALSVYPDAYITWESKGHALRYLGRDEEAQICYDEAKRLRALYNK